jgi:hypothetical protein
MTRRRRAGTLARRTRFLRTTGCNASQESHPEGVSRISRTPSGVRLSMVFFFPGVRKRGVPLAKFLVTAPRCITQSIAITSTFSVQHIQSATPQLALSPMARRLDRKYGRKSTRLRHRELDAHHLLAGTRSRIEFPVPLVCAGRTRLVVHSRPEASR